MFSKILGGKFLMSISKTFLAIQKPTGAGATKTLMQPSELIIHFDLIILCFFQIIFTAGKLLLKFFFYLRLHFRFCWRPRQQRSTAFKARTPAATEKYSIIISLPAKEEPAVALYCVWVW
jgi:hypothetical protein